MKNKYKYVLVQKGTSCMDLQRLQQMGKCLREARIAMGITQEEAAELAGVDVATMRRWENGETEPRNPNKERLCQVYRKKRHELFPQHEKVTILPRTETESNTPNVSLNRSELLSDRSLCLEVEISLPGGIQQSSQQPTQQQVGRQLQPFIMPGINGSVEVSMPPRGNANDTSGQHITIKARVYQEAMQPPPLRQAVGGEVISFPQPATTRALTPQEEENGNHGNRNRFTPPPRRPRF